MQGGVPDRVEELTPDYLTTLVAALRPGLAVGAATITEVRTYGDADSALSVSTSAQIRLDIAYGGAGAEGLPTKLLAKMSFPSGTGTSNPVLDAEFENEVDFYTRVRPELDLETPLALGGRFDPATGRFVLLLEDLAPRRPHIHSMADPSDPEAVAALLDTYARLHARFWDSPRLAGDLAWVQGQVTGPLETLFDGFVRDHIARELDREMFKREFVEELGTSEGELYACMKAVKRHQATLPQTILHGDAHMANTYRLPDGTGGLLDWQVSARGHAMHDIAYIIQTALSVAARRRHERDLLACYRDRLGAHGVADLPSAESLWLEYRRSLVYGFHMGWLTAPRENYGWEVAVLGNHRTKAACLDHGSVRLAAELI